MPQSRLVRERRTVESMIEIYCRGRHRQAKGLCAECEQLLAYATQRIDKCRFGENKPTCAKCAIHCYKPEMREKVRDVMRYAGPRMLWTHPILSLIHYIDEVKNSRKSKNCGKE
jgi:predicted amidophosphoribosyltransferase